MSSEIRTNESSSTASRHSRTLQRISFFLIGLGLIIGSVIAVFQSKPVEIEEGWTIENPIFQNQNTIVVPDQNGDGKNDLFIWINPREYIVSGRSNDTWMSELINWNKTTGAALFSGKSGELLQLVEFPQTSLFISGHQRFTMVCTSSEKVILLAAPVKNYSDQSNPNRFLDVKSYQLVSISLADLTIEKSVNITKAGWEPIEMLEDPNMVNNTYNPAVYFLRNQSVAAPYSSYKGDLLAIKTTLKFWNGTIYNVTKIMVHFIKADTLENVSSVDLDITKPAPDFSYHTLDIGFCEFPSKDTQYQWYAPFFYVLFTNLTGTDKANMYISMAPISNLKNYFDSMVWIIFKGQYLTLSNITSVFQIQFENKLLLNLNQTGMPTSLTILNQVKAMVNTTFSEGQRQQYANFFPWLSAKFYETIQAYAVTNINFENPMNISITFQDIGATENAVVNTYGWPVKESGVCYGVMPLKVSNQTNSTTLGVLFINNTFAIKKIKDFDYPFRLVSVFILKEEATGTMKNISSPFHTLITGMETRVVDIECVINPFGRSKIPYDFDIDKDGSADIPFAGVCNDNSIGDVAVKVVNGPYFTITSNKTVLQTHFYQIDKYMTSVFLSDVNGDGISDAFLNDRIMIFGKSGWDLEPSTSIQSRLQNAATRGWIILGIILFIAALVFIVISLFRRNSEKIIATNIRFLVVSFLVSIGLIYLMFYLQNQIVEASKQGIGTLIGTSASTLSIQAMIDASNLANFVFLSALPITLGIYVLSASIGAKSVVSLNQLIYKNNERYRIVLSPPFGRNLSMRELVSRVTSILFLATSIGLYSYNYVAPYFFDIASFDTIESISDPKFAEYMNAIFEFLVIPGIVSIPIFAWLFPSSWLLDDTGCLYYLKKGNARRPEDVESLGRWFGNTIKGFFGISAIINYIQFSLQSPILKIATALGEYGIMVMIYAFGFIIVAGISFGLLTVAVHEITLVNNAVKLVDDIQRKDVEIKRTSIDFSENETLTPERIVEGYKKLSSIRF